MNRPLRAVRPFRLIYEIRPPIRPTFEPVRRQVAHFAKTASAVLVPENPIGVPSISSVAVAADVVAHGAKSVVVLNARDRNAIGFRRDLLTATAAGIDEYLFVAGDRHGALPAGDLTVGRMLTEFREFAEQFGQPRATVNVTSPLRPVPAWKEKADGLFLQATFNLDDLLRWRDAVSFDGPIYAGVLVPPSVERAVRWTRELEGVSVPDAWIEALEADPLAGVDLSCDLVGQIEESGAFDGVHLIPGVRYREVVARLEDRDDRTVGIA